MAAARCAKSGFLCAGLTQCAKNGNSSGEWCPSKHRAILVCGSPVCKLSVPVNGSTPHTSSFTSAAASKRRKLGLITSAKVDNSSPGITAPPANETNQPATSPSSNGNPPLEVSPPSLTGEDAAVFDLSQQKATSWAYFFAVLAVVLAILYVVWLDPESGYGGAFVDALSSLSDSHEVVMLAILLIFGVVHSGLAALRPLGERLVGERAYRVLFAGISLPLSVSAVVYFINHRYEGAALWNLRGVPGMHEAMWLLSFLSFFLLYPSTFNLLEVAAVDRPQLHMWETGVMRITRHPQMWGQLLWCLAHTAWIGSSFTLATSAGLLAHHAFGVWHGDKRLKDRYGDAFEKVKARTSIVPFAAILEGRQELPADYYKEFLRAPYFAIIGVTVGAYFCHPLMQQGSYWLHW